MNRLHEIIRSEIAACGAISFARFMELSLYCPEFGYYERLANTPGRRGDFYTSVSVGSLFGELLAFQFAQWLGEIGAEKVQLIEAGAHDGRLAADILKWIKTHRPQSLDRLEYWIIEASSKRSRWQEETLENFSANVRWFDAWSDVPSGGVRGSIFSNELLDAMPAHRIAWDARSGNWFEWGVDFRDDKFVWSRMRLEVDAQQSHGARKVIDTAYLPKLPAELLAVLPDGFTTEVSPAAMEWWRRAAAVLKEGKLVTFDYGLMPEEIFSPERTYGTLRSYHGHRLSDDLLALAGEQDLTAHVNFSAIQEAGESAGLKTNGLFSQAQFMTRVAEMTWRDPSAFGEWTPARVRQFQTLTHPEHLGARFKVLVQSR